MAGNTRGPHAEPPWAHDATGLPGDVCPAATVAGRIGKAIRRAILGARAIDARTPNRLPHAAKEGGRDSAATPCMEVHEWLALVQTFRGILSHVADRNWTILDRIAPMVAGPWEEAAHVMELYDVSPVLPPEDYGAVLDVLKTPSGEYSVRAPLWTAEEGRSDLEIQAAASLVMEGLWSVRVDDLRVP